MAKLIFLEQQSFGRVFVFTEECTSVGRSRDNLPVIAHPSVSGHHCEILVYSTEVIVRDSQSTNGTYVDRVRVHQQRQVRSGQTLHFGRVAARLELGPEDETRSIDPSVESAIHELPPP